MKGKMKMSEQFNFEDAMKRLNQISEKLEQEDVAIDEALALFEEGLNLSKQCQAVLEGYEEKVKSLVAQHQNGRDDETV